jgi:hypothetical protein
VAAGFQLQEYTLGPDITVTFVFTKPENGFVSGKMETCSLYGTATFCFGSFVHCEKLNHAMVKELLPPLNPWHGCAN